MSQVLYGTWLPGGCPAEAPIDFCGHASDLLPLRRSLELPVDVTVIVEHKAHFFVPHNVSRTRARNRYRVWWSTDSNRKFQSGVVRTMCLTRKGSGVARRPFNSFELEPIREG